MRNPVFIFDHFCNEFVYRVGMGGIENLVQYILLKLEWHSFRLVWMFQSFLDFSHVDGVYFLVVVGLEGCVHWVFAIWFW